MYVLHNSAAVVMCSFAYRYNALQGFLVLVAEGIIFKAHDYFAKSQNGSHKEDYEDLGVIKV